MRYCMHMTVWIYIASLFTNLFMEVQLGYYCFQIEIHKMAISLLQWMFLCCGKLYRCQAKSDRWRNSLPLLWNYRRIDCKVWLRKCSWRNEVGFWHGTHAKLWPISNLIPHWPVPFKVYPHSLWSNVLHQGAQRGSLLQARQSPVVPTKKP